MTFWNHIDDLRKALLQPLLILIVLTVGAFLLKEPVFNILLAANSADFVTYTIAPGYNDTATGGLLLSLINIELPAQLLVHMKVSFYVGLILTLPFLFFKLFRFASPGLYKNERFYSARILFFSFVSFFSGILVNYFVIFPFSLRFLAAYQVADQVNNMISITSYLDTLMSLSVLMGICFELPIVSLLLSKLGILESGFLKKYRKHALVVIVIISAVITPTTDIFTLLLVSIPILFLYEFSIIITKVAERPQENLVSSEKE
jgi:sec-independent protein translocase protein TatC